MKAVLHVLWSLDRGGAERAVYQLVREQRQRGWSADVLVASQGGDYGDRVRDVGANVFELGQRTALDITVARRAARAMSQYPIVHVHGPEPVLVAVASANTHAHLVYTHRGGIRTYPLRKRLRHRMVAHYLRSRFDAISANTRQSAQAAAQMFRVPVESIQIVYNGLDFDLLRPQRSRAEVLHELGERGDVVRLGTAAMLRDWKRVDRLLHAVAALRDYPIHCVVIGDGPSRPELELLATRLGIDERVSFTGHKLHIEDYLQILDVFVLPSGPEEAFGNAVVEAMGVGLPSIVFADGGGLTEHVEDSFTGFVVTEQHDLERRLCELVASPELRRRIGGTASKAVRDRYTLDAMVSGYETVYNSLSE